MATVNDLVAQLVKRTENGDIQWEPFYWNDNGAPTGWAATERGCRFSVITNPVELSVSSPQIRRLTTLGKGEQVSDLVKVLESKFGEKVASTDEALAIALDCLTEHS